jgi:hypothetical protein
MHPLKIAVLFFALAAVSFAQTPVPPVSGSSAARLPVTRVILYKNGVGYFEHSGHVRGSQDVNVDFTTAQLNDVLKSLTVLDRGKGRITGVSYNSTAPIERQLGLLRLPVGENPTTSQFLTALRGARVEIRNGSVTGSGRLLSIEERDLPKTDPSKSDREEQQGAGEKTKHTQISIVSDGGELRVFDLTPATSVRVLEKDVNEEVGKYMGLIASTRDQDVRRMTISTAGDGDRDLLVSYISEVPVWKSTYRIVVPKEGKPLLQGWAIVDNTVGEDWKNVELSLVAGAPQSFVQELSQPYYSRRPVVALPENAMLTPQTHEATLEQYAKLGRPPMMAAEGVIGGVPGGVPGGQMGGVIGGVGAGEGGGTGGGLFRSPVVAPPPPHPDATEIAESLEEGTTVGQTQELGDLFEYKLKDRVTIRKNQSALVPILQTRIDAERVSLWNPSQDSVLRALWLDNNSSLTLDGGSFNVLEGDAFAGEGLMDAIKPGEKRLLSYAADLGLLVDAKQKNENPRVTRIVIAHGAMTQSTQERQEETYTVRNRDTSARVLILEHPARAGWKLADDEIPAETTASFHRFRIAIEPKTTQTLTVKEYRPVSNRWMLTGVTDTEVRFFLDQKMINPEVEKVLRSVVQKKNDIAVLDAVIAGRRAQVTNISDDQQRVRENMKALKGSAEEKALIERYVRELNEQEDRVQALRKEITEMQQKRDAAQSALTTMIENLQMEATL